MKLQTLQAVVAATLVCVGTPLLAQQQSAAANSGPPAKPTQRPESRFYQFPNNYLANAEATDGAYYEDVAGPANDQLSYNDYYADAPTPADGTDGAAEPAEPAAAGAGSCCASNPCGNCLKCCTDCCEPYWAHRTGFFAGLLVLRQRGHDVAYAVPRNGVDNTTATTFGTTSTVAPQYSLGYFGGFGWAIDRCTSIVGTYTYYQAETNNSLFANAPLTVHSLVTDPHTYTAASDGPAALARYNVRYQFADVDYRKLLAGGANYWVNWSIGTRYAQLTELFRSSQPLGPGATNVGSNIGFDGYGGRAGLLGQKRLRNRGLFFYGNGFASLLTGNVRASYLQTNTFAGVQSVNSWKDFRTVPILEYELGTGWQSANGRLRISGGYYFAAWFNTLGTANYIQNVQTQSFVNNWGNSSVTTFDGLRFTGMYVW